MAIFNFKKNILLEAEKENIEVEETDNVDYTEDIENDTPEETEDETAEDNEDQTDEESDETQEEDTAETEDEATDDTTDYTEDVSGEDTGEETTDDTAEQPAEEEAPSEDTVKNAALLKDIIDLYYENINIINKIDSFIDVNYKVNQVCVQAKNNLTTLNEYLFDFISGPFKTNSYVKNLYVYQYALEIVKINIEMFRNISDFNSM